MKANISDTDLCFIGTALRNIKRCLAQVSPSPGLDSEVLIASVLKKERAYLWAFPDAEIDGAQRVQLRALVERRCSGEPIAYILEKKEFWGLSLSVNSSVLIPRPDTETLVERVLICLESLSKDHVADLNMLDVGTGSGAICLAVLQSFDRVRCWGVDVSIDALMVAMRNAKKWGGGRYTLLQSNWASAIMPDSVHLFASNPPYIRTNHACLGKGDVRFEPETALVGGETGLEAYEILIDQAWTVLRAEGYLVFEHGYDQGQEIRDMLHQAGFVSIVTDLDLARHERVTWCQKPLDNKNGS